MLNSVRISPTLVRGRALSGHRDTINVATAAIQIADIPAVRPVPVNPATLTKGNIKVKEHTTCTILALSIGLCQFLDMAITFRFSNQTVPNAYAASPARRNCPSL